MRTSISGLWRTWPRRLWRIETVWGAVAIVSALCIFGYHHPDEQGQITAFYLYKAGIVPAAHLPWEFDLRLRPWLQPAMYYALLGPWIAAFGYDFRLFERASLLIQAALVLAVLGAFARLLRSEASASPSEAKNASDARLSLGIGARARWGFVYLASLWFLPSMVVRHSSEALAAVFLCGSLVLYPRVEDASRQWTTAFLSGVFAGLSFWARFQMGLFFAGFLVALFWTTMRRRHEQSETRGPVTRWPVLLLLGSLSTVPLGIGLDRWGYGEWVFTPWNYLRENILEGRASDFGERPWHYYFYQVPLVTLNPLIWVWLFVASKRHWATPYYRAISVGLALFVFVHTAIPHKELRFLLPMVCPAMVLLAHEFGRATSAETPPSSLSLVSRFLRHGGMTRGYLRTVTILQLIVLSVFTAFGLVSDLGRVEQALWALPRDSNVITPTPLYVSFGARPHVNGGPSADDPRRPSKPVPIDARVHEIVGVDIRHAFMFAKPPHVDLVYVPAEGLREACATGPQATYALLTNKRRKTDGRTDVNVLANDIPAVAQFPPAFLSRWTRGLRGIWQFKLVRCADLVHGSVDGP